MVSLRQRVFRYCDRQGVYDIQPSTVAEIFKKYSPNSVKTYVNQWKKKVLEESPTPDLKPSRISNILNIPKNIENETPQKIRIKPPEIEEIGKITEELVEYWILTGDDRADLGMKFLQNKKKFTPTIEEEEDNDFEEMLKQVLI